MYKIDAQRDLVFVLGSVPGPQGSILRIVDSRKASTRQQNEAIYDLPVPTMVPGVRLIDALLLRPTDFRYILWGVPWTFNSVLCRSKTEIS